MNAELMSFPKHRDAFPLCPTIAFSGGPLAARPLQRMVGHHLAENPKNGGVRQIAYGRMKSGAIFTLELRSMSS